MTEKLLDLRSGPRRRLLDDAPTVRQIVRDAGARRLPVVVARPRDREERAVPDARRVRS